MDRHVHFNNEAFEDEATVNVTTETATNRNAGRNENDAAANEDDISFYSLNESDSDDGSIDYTSLDTFKFNSDVRLLSEAVNEQQIAILERNDGNEEFDDLEKVLISKKQSNIDAICQSACDALFSYFCELSEGGPGLQVDYMYLENLFTGEGGKKRS